MSDDKVVGKVLAFSMDNSGTLTPDEAFTDAMAQTMERVTPEEYQALVIAQRENLERMLSALLEVESELEALEHNKKELKAQIQSIVETLPWQKAEFPGIGTVQMTKAGTTVSYDKDALESLTAQLLQNGEMRTAQAIADCRKESPRKSSLMFRRQKG